MAEGFPYGEVGEELVEEVLRCEDAKRRGRLLGYLRLARFGEVKGLGEMVELLLERFVGGGDRREEDGAALWHCLEIAKRNGMEVGGIVEGERLMVHEKTGLAVVLVPKGKFLMGSEEGESNEVPVREVELTYDCWLAKHPVTCWDWARYMGEGAGPRPEDWEDGRYHGWHRPVVGVSWEEAKGYCEWGGLRLPSEADWERAARGGREGEWPWEGGEGRLGEFAWYGERDWNAGAHGAGLLLPGRYGLFDMLGNVDEWCEDWYGEYDPAERRDPVGDSAGNSRRIGRGASWVRSARWCRSGYRYGWSPDERLQILGFRVCLALSESVTESPFSISSKPVEPVPPRLELPVVKVKWEGGRLRLM